MSSQFSLLKTRRFLPFFTTQFLGAFNDNVFKQGLIILLTYRAVTISSLPVEIRAPLCQAIFILPFFLFSATAGQIADAWDKAVLIRLIKTLEVGIMALACAGFYANNLAFLITALFLLGIHSTLFGPIKYAILPQALRADELVGGNGLVEMGTSVAILVGSILGGYLITLPGDTGIHALSIAIVAVAVVGLGVAFYIPRSGVAAPDLKVNWNPVTESIRNLSFIRANRTVFLSVLGISWFWFYGVTMLSNIPALTKEVLGGNEYAVILLMTTMSVGTGIGSLLCERLSGKKVELGLVPFGAIGLTAFGVDIWFATLSHPELGAVPAATIGAFLDVPGNTRVLVDFFGLGVFSGFYIVPLYALVQARSEPSHRSRVIAGNNILNALFMVVASLMAVGLLKAGVSLPGLLAITALLSALVSIYIFTVVPEFLMRFLVWMFMSVFYRVDRRNTDRIPEEGACVLVCNHVSFFDALILATAIRRPPRFVMDHNIFKNPVLNFIFRTARAIPIAPYKVDPALLEKAYDDIATALENGEMVCIFPEGRITDTGEIYPFKNGIQRIVERTPVPVIPMALQGMWGSFSSRKGGAAFTKFPRRFRSHVALHVGTAVEPAAATPERLEAEVRALRGDWK
ncbi:MAG: putative acyltransferase family protein [Moraxellaceae bacterium]|jgi:1-acyl-sn-glycerol-3-phosphate acyltransferase|nr:putative acyltransferase family protein [Moraxellaceae bacterium]